MMKKLAGELKSTIKKYLFPQLDRTIQSVEGMRRPEFKNLQGQDEMDKALQHLKNAHDFYTREMND